jgi:hypothetical protein
MTGLKLNPPRSLARRSETKTARPRFVVRRQQWSGSASHKNHQPRRGYIISAVKPVIDFHRLRVFTRPAPRGWYLKKLFNDLDKSVRAPTDHCFRKISDKQLSEETDLISSFISSKAFADDAAQLCLALKDSTSLLPDVVCGVAEKLIQIHRQRHGEQAFDRFFSSGHYISELIVRLYQQTMDARTKSRCLDIIDELLRVEIWGADEELEKAERWSASAMQRWNRNCPSWAAWNFSGNNLHAAAN